MREGSNWGRGTWGWRWKKECEVPSGGLIYLGEEGRVPRPIKRKRYRREGINRAGGGGGG